MAICVDCIFILDLNKGFCNNPELPVTDYVYGTRDCKELNPKGNCKGFKPNSEIGCIKPESIYELKEDEELAKTRSKEDVLSLTDKR